MPLPFDSIQSGCTLDNCAKCHRSTDILIDGICSSCFESALASPFVKFLLGRMLQESRISKAEADALYTEILEAHINGEN